MWIMKKGLTSAGFFSIMKMIFYGKKFYLIINMYVLHVFMWLFVRRCRKYEDDIPTEEEIQS